MVFEVLLKISFEKSEQLMVLIASCRVSDLIASAMSRQWMRMAWHMDVLFRPIGLGRSSLHHSHQESIIVLLR